jgi:hypothetical protein
LQAAEARVHSQQVQLQAEQQHHSQAAAQVVQLQQQAHEAAVD